MKNIKITVTNKRAKLAEEKRIVCGNSDYTVTFAFDDEWAAHSVKTARFRYKVKGLSRKQDVVFSGNTCPVPALSNTEEVQIGVYAGDMRTTTAAAVPCDTSILCGSPVHDKPPEDVYRQIVELCDGANTSAEQAAALAEQAAASAAQAEPHAAAAKDAAAHAETCAQTAHEAASEARLCVDESTEYARQASLSQAAADDCALRCEQAVAYVEELSGVAESIKKVVGV